MSLPATLRIRRKARKGNSSTSSKEWMITLDGHLAGAVAAEETLDVEIEPGSHTLQVRSSSLLTSPEVSFCAVEGQVIGYSCRPRSPSPVIASRWLFWLLASLLRRGLWIGLDVDDTLGSVESTKSVTTNPVRPLDSADTPRQGTLTTSVRATLAESTAVRRHAPGDSVLVVENLTKRFGSRTAFSDVSFDVGYGEVFGFLGPNGAGKTTTVRTLGTLLRPTFGSAIVAGIPLLERNAVAIREKIAIMPESPGLYLRLSVKENLAYFAGLYGLRHAGQRIDEALEAVNLRDRANDLCGGLSKGLRQRVGLARTLLSDPAIMFLDEPTSGLDPVASLEVHNLIIGLKAKGVSIFLTTHRLDEAEKLCDRVAIMKTKLRTVGTIDDLRSQLFKRALTVRTVAPLADPTQFFSAIGSVEAWQNVDANSYLLTVEDPQIAAPDVTRALVGAGADVLSIGESQHSLEDVYLELIGEDRGAAAT
jgi:ABC-2 type transport system ATP-binding protein